MKTTKRTICLLLVLVTMCSLMVPAVSAASTTPYDAFNSTSYGRTYTLATSGRQTVYTGPDLQTPGNIERGACNAWIDCAADELRVFDVGESNGKLWAFISYPVSGGRRTGYIPLSAITANTYAVSATASGKFYCSPRKGQSINSSYYVDKNDKVTLIAVDGDMIQLIYPSSGGCYRMAWAKKSDWIAYCGSIPSTSSGNNSSTEGTTTAPASGSFVRIRYSVNGRYLDVPAEGIADNGTQLQVWDYAYGNQNQIFQLLYTSKGWQIISLQSGKCVEVRNSSHDDYAHVAQWERHTLTCAYWDLVANSDGTVSFRNKESGKFLNICGGGDAPNGTKAIQYHNDGTSAMRFYIEVLNDSDVLSATYNRTISNSELKWTQYNPITSYTINNSGYSMGSGKNCYYPTPGQKIFVSAEYLSPNTVATLIQNKSYAKTFKSEIASALAGEMTESGIAALLSKMGFGDVPGLGLALGILQTLADSSDAEKWNEFVSTAKFDATGRCSGVIIYTYHTICRNPVWTLDPTKCAYVWKYFITTATTVEYKRWTGDNFGSVKTLPVNGTSGTWSYSFK